jgi:hypothetical protein
VGDIVGYINPLLQEQIDTTNIKLKQMYFIVVYVHTDTANPQNPKIITFHDGSYKTTDIDNMVKPSDNIQKLLSAGLQFKVYKEGNCVAPKLYQGGKTNKKRKNKKSIKSRKNRR